MCSVAFRLVVPPIYNHQITSRFTELAYALRFSNFKFTLHTSGSTSWMSLLHVISVTRHILFFLVFALLSHAVLPPSHVKKKSKRFRVIPSLPGNVGISISLLLVLLLLVFCFAKLRNAGLEPPRNISVAVIVLQCRHCYTSCASNVLCTCCYATAVVSSEFRIVLAEFHFLSSSSSSSFRRRRCRRRRRRSAGQSILSVVFYVKRGPCEECRRRVLLISGLSLSSNAAIAAQHLLAACAVPLYSLVRGPPC